MLKGLKGEEILGRLVKEILDFKTTSEPVDDVAHNGWVPQEDGKM